MSDELLELYNILPHRSSAADDFALIAVSEKYLIPENVEALEYIL